jgi:hypothetical protein
MDINGVQGARGVAGPIPKEIAVNRFYEMIKAIPDDCVNVKVKKMTYYEITFVFENGGNQTEIISEHEMNDCYKRRSEFRGVL